jgi:hypothetical protein
MNTVGKQKVFLDATIDGSVTRIAIYHCISAFIFH